MQPSRALDAIWELVSAANKYVDQTEPWKLAKQNDIGRLGQVVYTVLETLRYLGIMLWPFMPTKCDELLSQLGLGSLEPEAALRSVALRVGEACPGASRPAPARRCFRASTRSARAGPARQARAQDAAATERPRPGKG